MPDIYLATGHTAGEECSSTYEGRHLTLEESYLAHPTHADGFVDVGDPVIDAGGQHIVGVAFASAAAATDLIALDTEGIWFLTATGSDDDGNSPIQYGDQIYINITTAVLSKITNLATQRPFGYALGTVATGTSAVVAIKVHWDPSVDNQRKTFNTVTSGAYGKHSTGILTSGASEGVAHYFSSQILGTTTGHIYGVGSWIDAPAATVLAAGFIVVPYEGGVWSNDANAAARIVFAGQHQAILAGAPASLHAWRLNATQTIDALIAAANPGSVGYVADATTDDAKVGGVPMFDIVGHGIVWVRCYAGGS